MGKDHKKLTKRALSQFATFAESPKIAYVYQPDLFEDLNQKYASFNKGFFTF